MADKYLKQVGGALAEQEALTESAGAGDAGKIVALGSAGRLDESVMPVGIGADVAVIQASENLAAGDLVNVHNDGGPRVRKADASNGRRAHGFVLSAVGAGNNASVYKEGSITELTGKTPGAPQYLSAGTAGAMTETAPTGSGQIVQLVGHAMTATEVDFEPAQPITLA